MDTNRIIIEENNVRYSVFTLGYDKSGGYFIKDLSITKKQYYITKTSIRLSGAVEQHAPINHNQEWTSKYRPKLMHHIDGSTQISGTKIRSGFFKTVKKPKGVMTVSPNFNDGGPIFTFLCWGLENFDTRTKKGIIFEKKHISSGQPILDGDKFEGYGFEGFYLPRAAVSSINLTDGTILFRHPNFGVIPLKYVPAPSNSPGIIAISCRRMRHGFESNHGFTYGGGVTKTDENGCNTQIHVLYPFDGEFKKIFEDKSMPKSLHFNFKYRMVCWADDFMFTVLNFIKKYF